MKSNWAFYYHGLCVVYNIILLHAWVLLLFAQTVLWLVFCFFSSILVRILYRWVERPRETTTYIYICTYIWEQFHIVTLTLRILQSAQSGVSHLYYLYLRLPAITILALYAMLMLVPIMVQVYYHIVQYCINFNLVSIISIKHMWRISVLSLPLFWCNVSSVCTCHYKCVCCILTYIWQVHTLLTLPLLWLVSTFEGGCSHMLHTLCAMATTSRI
jgi:hypothetical protein